MDKSNAKAWRCTVCGYIHAGDEAPDVCPVCGAVKAEFEPYGEAGTVGPTAQPTGLESRPGGGARSARVAIVGAGIAGVSAAEAIRRVSPDSAIILIATDAEPPYYRLNLTRYLAGEITRDAFPLHPETWYGEQKIDLICGATVERLAPDTRRVVLTDGRELPYEKLILAMGAHSYVPSLQGTHRDGVVSLRTAADGDEILRRLRPGLRCVCIGGGVLGIETAGALARRGAVVSLLESHDWLMPRQLNLKGAGVLEAHIGKLGITVVKNARTREVTGDDRVTGVALEDGRSFPADLVVLAMGVRPNTALARKAGIEVNNGIIVNNHLECSLPDVFAAGDVAEHNGQVYGSWAASQFQGEIAGLNAVGVRTAFGGLPRSNTIKALGLDLTSIGRFQPEDGSYVSVESEEPGVYLEFVFRDGRMVGAILIGHSELAAPVRKAIESGSDFSALLQAGPTCAEVTRRLSP